MPMITDEVNNNNISNHISLCKASFKGCHILLVDMNRSMLTKLTNHLFPWFLSTLPIPLLEHLVSDLVFLENLFNTFVKMIDGKREESGGKCRKWPQLAKIW